MQLLTKFLLTTLLLLSTNSSWALKADADQPINIKADRMEIDDPAGSNLYIGNVHITQGSFEIIAERLEIHSRNNQIERLTATGSAQQRARFKQLTDEGQETTAKADRIDYFAPSAKLILQGSAEFKNHQNLIQGNLIDYNTHTHKLIAGQAAPAKTHAKPERVHVTIQPQKNKPKDSR